jgi:hypothetical protein
MRALICLVIFALAVLVVAEPKHESFLQRSGQKPIPTDLQGATKMQEFNSSADIKFMLESSSDSSRDGWKKAGFTWYTSYAACCPQNPNYDPQADSSECDDYSACEYSGEFAAIGHKEFSWVQSHDIISFYDNSDKSGKKFEHKYGGKTIKLRKNGVEFTALIADTCGNDDCDDCCKKNSKHGYLVDMEEWTVKRRFGNTDAANGIIEFMIVK